MKQDNISVYVKQYLISSTINFACKLPNELPNDLRLSISGN